MTPGRVQGKAKREFQKDFERFFQKDGRIKMTPDRVRVQCQCQFQFQCHFKRVKISNVFLNSQKDENNTWSSPIPMPIQMGLLKIYKVKLEILDNYYYKYSRLFDKHISYFNPPLISLFLILIIGLSYVPFELFYEILPFLFRIFQSLSFPLKVKELKDEN